MSYVGAWWWRFHDVGSDVGQINEVTPRRAKLLLGWMEIFLSLTNHHV